MANILRIHCKYNATILRKQILTPGSKYIGQTQICDIDDFEITILAFLHNFFYNMTKIQI